MSGRAVGWLILGALFAVIAALGLLRPMWLVQIIVTGLSIVVFLGVLGGVLFLLIIGIEQIRRWRADRGGFSTFLAAGARHDHPALIAALTGQPVPGAEDAAAPQYDLHPLGPLAFADAKGKLAVGDVLTLLDEDLPGATLDLGEALPELLETVVLRARQDGDQRVAAVALVLPGQSLAATAYLAPAWRRGEREAAAATRSLPTLDVDSASIAIGSPQGLRTISKRVERGAEDLGVGPADGANPYLVEDPAALWKMTGTERNPVLMLLTGLGDGSYPLWAARDGQDRLLGLIADFQLMPTKAVRQATETKDAAA